ncbi:MAG TPA: flagellar filament capping protein FliD [Candidatus Acidoferrales bacterium]|jgi:flagellar hook-associated protein 2|nr:flagellar filament capping protein FliD [Candidatus Acidoferrales bacterium]
MSGTLASIGTSANSNNTLSSSLAVSGIASGMNWQNTVSELANAERAPETQWQSQQATISQQKASYSQITTDLATLQSDATGLMDPAFFNSTVASSSSVAVASASSVSGATVGNFSFNISQLATAAQVIGAPNVSQVLDPGGDPSTVTVGAAGFSSPVSAGTFTVNGAQINIATTDSLKQVFDNIASATGNKVTASYDATTDKITLASSDGSPIILGSSTDTSNFLQTAQLYNNNSGTISSASALGHVNNSAALSSADLATPITDGGSGNGAFTINGVTINYNAGTDSVKDVLSRINNSAAGVTASYDSVNNRFVLANNTTGDVGIAMQDVTGNFLAATGLSGGTLNHGKNLLYTLNGGSQQLVSQSNTIDSSTSGITGLSVTALTTGITTVGVSSDTATISNAIQKFVTDYNSTQAFIASQMAVTTAADGSVTPGILTGDTNATDIVSSLRNMMTQVENITGTSGVVKSLTDMGFKSNGQDNTIALGDSSTLSSTLAGSMNDIKALFSDPVNGLARLMNTYITNTTGASGTLVARTTDLTTQSADLTTQTSNLENKIATDSALWTTEFQNMETATAQTNQELSYLSQSVSSGSL